MSQHTHFVITFDDLEIHAAMGPVETERFRGIVMQTIQEIFGYENVEQTELRTEYKIPGMAPVKVYEKVGFIVRSDEPYTPDFIECLMIGVKNANERIAAFNDGRIGIQIKCPFITEELFSVFSGSVAGTRPEAGPLG